MARRLKTIFTTEDDLQACAREIDDATRDFMRFKHSQMEVYRESRNSQGQKLVRLALKAHLDATRKWLEELEELMAIEAWTDIWKRERKKK